MLDIITRACPFTLSLFLSVFFSLSPTHSFMLHLFLATYFSPHKLLFLSGLGRKLASHVHLYAAHHNYYREFHPDRANCPPPSFCSPIVLYECVSVGIPLPLPLSLYLFVESARKDVSLPSDGGCVGSTAAASAACLLTVETDTRLVGGFFEARCWWWWGSIIDVPRFNVCGGII